QAIPEFPKEFLADLASTSVSLRKEAQRIEILSNGNDALSYYDIAMWPMKNQDGSLAGTILLTVDATERIRIANEREDFVATLTHDLRTPLIGTTQLLDALADKWGEQLPAETATIFTLIRDSNSDLLEMINNLLEIYRVDSGEEMFHFHQ